MKRSPEGTHADMVFAVAHSTAASAFSSVAASWRRSLMLYGLDPDDTRAPERLSAGEINEARERIAPILHVAQPTLDRLFCAVGDTGCCVLLTDSAGVPLERRGASADDETFYRWGLWTGAIWNEERQGTNGIGTCIAEKRPVTIHRDEHFHSRNVHMSCMDAPIFDHRGRLAAALDVSSCRADHTDGFVRLIAGAVVDAARQIEADHFRHAFSQARIVLVPGDTRGRVALIALDKDDLVIGATRAARQILDLGDPDFDNPRPAADVLSFGGAIDLASAERGAVQRALARSGGNVTAAARLLGISRATLHRKLQRFGLRGAP